MTRDLPRLYRTWAEGGVGLSITGNVMIDRRHIGEPGNVVLGDKWGGSPKKRMRFVVEVYKAIRAATGEHFGVGIKLNSGGGVILKPANKNPGRSRGFC
ncbi:hypothetical protein [Marinobacter panjinensis]|uniref:oxidoreductase n=1 Tax=Marinobacter panjinensis TaxID=2576384 RepID=UPI0031F392B7